VHEDDLQRYLDWLEGHGTRFRVAEDLWQDSDHRGPLIVGDGETRAIELPGLPPFVEHRDPGSGLAADHATIFLARTLLGGGHLARGGRFWEIGCGTGVLAVMAGLAGARTIIATDIDARPLTLARRTAADANIAVTFCRGSLLEPVPLQAVAEVVTANLPHKPVAAPHVLPPTQDGGPEGDRVHCAFASQAEARLPEGTRVFFFLHSLPHPRVLHCYHESFELTLLAWKRRFLGPREYGALQDHYVERAKAGTSFLVDRDGERHLMAGIWRMQRR
jgi:hypothetical protein